MAVDGMKICISGLSGSGKNSVGKLAAKALGFRLVNPTFKTIAAKQKMKLMEFQKKAENDHSIDRKFDEALVKEAGMGDCVVTTWLGPWVIKDATLRVWLFAPHSVRASRVGKRDGMGADEASRHVSDRDASNHERYMKVYGINIYDHSGFDLIINSERFAPEQSAQIVAAAAGAIGKRANQPAKKKPKSKR